MNAFKAMILELTYTILATVRFAAYAIITVFAISILYVSWDMYNEETTNFTSVQAEFEQFVALTDVVLADNQKQITKLEAELEKVRKENEELRSPGTLEKVGIWWNGLFEDEEPEIIEFQTKNLEIPGVDTKVKNWVKGFFEDSVELEAPYNMNYNEIEKLQ